MSNSTFSATASALGYLYQFKLALVCALRRVRKGEEFQLALETLDDVVFEKNGEPSAILQAKHHRKRSANLTDASPDLWKTLRVWCEGTTTGKISPDALLYLVTTSTAGEQHAPACMRPENRNVQQALQRLRATAQSSDSRTNQAAYQAFNNLSADEQEALVDRIVVLDAAPNISDIDEKLRQQACFIVSPSHLDAFLQRMEGWWVRRVIQQLSDVDTDRISSEELGSKVGDLREQFHRGALPIDEDIFDVKIDLNSYEDDLFVKQLRLINIGDGRVLFAIRDYYRAFEQRSRWVREELLLGGELDRYERKLIEEWDFKFERMKDGLVKGATEETKLSAAEVIYAWVESGVPISIRPGVTEPFITRGSYHILADELTVGWHPDYYHRLQNLLENPEATS